MSRALSGAREGLFSSWQALPHRLESLRNEVSDSVLPWS
jgi:hypothetical protein